MTIEKHDAVALTAQAIVRWIDGHAGLLSGLAALRELGSQADRAVQEVLALRELEMVRLSFQLFEDLAQGDERDARALLRVHGSPAHARRLDAALFDCGTLGATR